MTAKTGWEKSTNGPDWMDVEMLMRAIEAVHGGHVALVFSPRGIGSSGGLDVAASCILDVVPDASVPASVVVDKRWPCNTHKQLAPHAFALLHQLDYAVGEAYKQRRIFE